jgi:hypothetical protein
MIWRPEAQGVHDTTKLIVIFLSTSKTVPKLKSQSLDSTRFQLSKNYRPTILRHTPIFSATNCIA